MATSLIEPERITALNDRRPASGRYVLYWMQAAVRSRDNRALEYAVRTANDLDLPLVVGFGIDPTYEDATPRTLGFLADGLVDVGSALARRRIGFVVRHGAPHAVAEELSADAAAVIADRGYLRGPRRWRRDLAGTLDAPLVEVETNVVVPVEVASDRREWAARTLRPKIHGHLDRFVVELRTTAVGNQDPPALSGLEVGSAKELLAQLGIPHDPDAFYRGGQWQAYAALDAFLQDGIDSYSEAGTAVDGSASSRLSMYLHFGHVCPVEIIRRTRTSGAPREAVNAFEEELVVRRELAHNFVWFEPDYDSFRALPEWARTTLDAHRDDERAETYTRAQLEAAETGDRYWNAAMTEMRETGYLHNRMRMYWGKRILEWTRTPEYAYRVALELNNALLLDGRDPSSYANVGWLAGLHDQAFAERPVIGKVRPMTRAGLERKIDANAYVEYVERLTGCAIA